MKFSRLAVYAFIISCNIQSFLIHSVQAQTVNPADTAPSFSVPSSNNGGDHTSSPLPNGGGNIGGTSPSFPGASVPADSDSRSQEGKDRLRSAYDRSSNPAYYEMLDRLERNQKHNKQSHHSTDVSSGDHQEAYVASGNKHHSKHHRSHSHRVHHSNKRHSASHSKKHVVHHQAAKASKHASKKHAAHSASTHHKKATKKKIH